MHFIKYHPLKQKLRDRNVSDREALPYLAVFSGSTALVGAFPMFNGFNHWDFASGAFSVILAVGGVIYAYSCNGGRQGFDLIQKYVVLGWVVVIRCLLVSIPLLIVGYVAGEALGAIKDDTGIFDVLLIAVFEVFLYQRIGRHIRDTRTTESEQDGGGNALEPPSHPSTAPSK
jgi:hypothetical protein